MGVLQSARASSAAKSSRSESTHAVLTPHNLLGRPRPGKLMVEEAMTPSPERPLLLASTSPRRRELLALAGIPFEVVRAEADESTRPGEPPRERSVARVARA